ncbi:ATP-binding cassette domain-containing protein [Lentzea cavernae]|uniref:ABC transporter ATP-binding protein n=1 Tax=Lentzea cavernae TaxID=2020703 RepID=A0ABQ3MVP3_9PSEU|nr:ATP-binding cassette domain-containing protein [Lentzea cavernae]GHH50551.1 ABC transporter ATP-binding protein [Lentzea cavernae]
MEIHASRAGVNGGHGPLLRPTSLSVKPGELTLVAGEPGGGHTALALLLSGRMKPSTGTVSPDAKTLRKRVVLVDAPEVNEPEEALTLSAVVGEELAMNRMPSGKKAVHDWLVEHAADEHADKRFEHVPAQTRCAVMLDLAAARPGVTALVLDCPDRYHPNPREWFALAHDFVTPERSVVVLCSNSSAHILDIPHARLGEDNDDTKMEIPA